MKKVFLVQIILFIQVLGNVASSQKVYKTPSGKKYHLETCRMVENVSKLVLLKSTDNEINLSPCKICKPPLKKFKVSTSKPSKAVGSKTESVQCKGKTAKGLRCKHRTRIANGYCYQHKE